MTIVERRLMHGLTVIVAATGVAYGVMKYVIESTDPFAVVNHPWQPAMLALHLLSAPLLVLVVGMAVRSHVIPKVGTGPANRRTGLVAFAAFLVMVMSGYLLQVVATEWLAAVTFWAHMTSSGVFLVLFVAHLVIGRRLARQARRSPARVSRLVA